MFDTDTLISDCQDAINDVDPRGAARDVLLRRLRDTDDVATALGKDEAGLNVLFNAPHLTVLNVIWAPGMTLYPHDHRMWAAIGVYGGSEDNTLYRRGPDRIAAAGGRLLKAGDVFNLGAEAIHAVHNPERRFTGAIHVYGGDFLNTPRSQWDPDGLQEQPWNLAQVKEQFAVANAQWSAQLGQDVDERAY